MSQATITLPAGQERTVSNPGRVFAVLSAQAGFDIVPDKGDKTQMAPGRKVGLPAGVRRLRLIETNGASNTVTYYTGDEDIQLDAKQGFDLLTGQQILVVNPPTLIHGIFDGSLASSAVLTPVGGIGFFPNQISIIASNYMLGTSRVLALVDNLSDVVARICPGDTLEVVTSENLFLLNDSGADIKCSLSQKVYA